MSKELIERLRSFCSKADCADAGDLIEELETENDKLREQVKMLREVVNDALSGMGGGYAIWSPRAQEVLAATEPK